jgi:hypothetical protein
VRPRVLLVVANLFGWLLFVALRDPMPPTYFAEQDEWHRSGTFQLNSGYPALVLAGRPLWNWSPFHGGEAWPVKALELANLPGLIAAFFAYAVFFMLRCSAFTSSMLAYAVLLILSTAQWWLCGLGLERFRSLRSPLPGSRV